MPTFDRNALTEIIAEYKRSFSEHRPEEIYKWEAVKHFQDNWKIHSENFIEMLRKSLGKQYNLLTQYEYMGLIALAKENTEFLRDMFIQLYADDDITIDKKVDKFMSSANELSNANFPVIKHNQNERAVSVYLFLYKPEKNFIYNRVGKFIRFAEKISYSGHIAGIEGINKLQSYYAMCEEILAIVRNDEELIRMSTDSLLPPDKFYQDLQYRLLTDDIVYFGKNKQNSPGEWWPDEEEYHPGIDKEQWKQLWANEAVFNSNSKIVVRSIFAYKDGATCKMASQRYGKPSGFYNIVSSTLAKRIYKETNCELPPDDGNSKWWPILYMGKRAGKDIEGGYMWQLRPELREALYELGETALPPNTEKKPFSMDKNIILCGAPGTGKTYSTVIYAVAIIEEKPIEELKYEEYSAVYSRYQKYLNDGLVTFTTFHQSFGYEEFIEGIRPVLISDSDSDTNIEYEIRDGIFKKFCEKAGTPVGGGMGVDIDIGKSPTVWKVSLEGTGANPTRQECLQNGHIRIGWDDYGEIINDITKYGEEGGRVVLNAFYNRMQIGDIVLSCYSSKTIDAIGVVTGDAEWHGEYAQYKRLRNVKWIVKGINEDIVALNGGKTMTLSSIYKLSVSVNDVIILIRKINPQLFTSSVSRQNHVIIIDEINRGNISKLFGELITLIESSRRIGASEELRTNLPYSGLRFGVPDNVYIIGTMNTADRSIAMMDTALRRRFSFVEMQPDSSVLEDIDDVEGISISQMLDIMNQRITVLYDREHTIGHSFFMPLKDAPSLTKLAEIIEKKIIPLLQEYFFDDYEKIRLVLGDNQKDAKALQFVIKKSVAAELFGKAEIDDTDYYEINPNAFGKVEAYEFLKKKSVLSNN